MSELKSLCDGHNIEKSSSNPHSENPPPKNSNSLTSEEASYRRGSGLQTKSCDPRESVAIDEF